MRFFVGVTAAFAAGGLIGVAIGIIATEDKFRKEYQESSESLRRAMELARQVKQEPEAPAEEEGELLVSPMTFEPAQVEETEEHKDDLPFDPAGGLVLVQDFAPQMENPYHKAVEGVQENPSFELIEEEDFHGDNGRLIAQITITMDDHNPLFFENGMECKDWEVKIGENILRDFYVLCPPGTAQVLFVRNHTNDTDYEVIREMP